MVDIIAKLTRTSDATHVNVAASFSTGDDTGSLRIVPQEQYASFESGMRANPSREQRWSSPYNMAKVLQKPTLDQMLAKAPMLHQYVLRLGISINQLMGRLV